MKSARGVLYVLVGGLVLSLGVNHGWAHPGLDEQIAALTERIQQEPGNAVLYLRRGEVHRHHQDWPRATADYDQAARLDPRLDTVDLARGMMHFDAGNHEAAKAALDRFLAKHPDHPDALVTRARALAALGQPLLAVADNTRALAQPAGARPELYIERARLQSPVSDAIRGLDEGLAKLGPAVTLELAAMELELKQNNFAAALRRLDRIAARSARQENWLLKRGEILEQAGRKADARQAYAAATAAINTLPSSRRHTGLVQDLEQRLEAALRRLE